MFIAKFRKFIIVLHKAPINLVTATRNLEMIAIKLREFMTTLGKVVANTRRSVIRAVLFTVKVLAFITNAHKVVANLPIFTLISPKDISNLLGFTSVLIRL